MLIWKGNASQEREPITSSGCCHGALLIIQHAVQELPGRLGVGMLGVGGAWSSLVRASHCLYCNADKKGLAGEPGKEGHFQHVLVVKMKLK